mmetsp:Transcript_4008/g.10034  ORF Transcript_4008/g.10034 Transcript_4008/m.10034 type:complete len:527 (-) Transcript_4008:21-1601(-)
MHGDAFDNRLNDWRPEGSPPPGDASPSLTDRAPTPLSHPRSPAVEPAGLWAQPSLPASQGAAATETLLLATAQLNAQREAARAEVARREAAAATRGCSPTAGGQRGGSPGSARGVSLWVDEEGHVGAGEGGDGQSVYLPSEWADCAESTVVEELLDATAWTVEPELVHPSVPLLRNFYWCPWTKTYVPIGRERRIQRLWCWQTYNLPWWTGFLFIVGSVGFFTGAIAACYRHPGPGAKWYKIWGELMPYLGGGLCFVAGAVTLTLQSYQCVDWDTHRDVPGYEKLLDEAEAEAHRLQPGMQLPTATEAPARSFLGVWEVVPAPGEGLLDQPVTLPRRESSGQRVHRRVAAEEEFQRLWLQYDPWARRQHIVELAGSFIIFLGTLFYKTGLFTDLYLTLAGEDALPPRVSYHLMTSTLQVGSAAFVVGGYLLLASYEQAWLPWRLLAVNPRRASLAWWIVMLNMAGSLLFMLGSIPLHVKPPAPGIADTFVQNFFGWALGSACFFVQSWLMIIEVACSEDDVLPEML